MGMTGSRIPRLVLPEAVPGADKFNRWIDLVITRIEQAFTPSASGNLTITSSPAGLHFHVPDFPIAIVATASNFTARSGNTPGSGTLNFFKANFNGSTVALVADAARQGVKAYNYSSNTTTPPQSGKYGVAMRWYGVWWLVVVEC